MARVANEYLKEISDPRRRQILINFRDHALAECLGDHEALMATCSKGRQTYAVHTDPELNAIQPTDWDSLFDYYKMLIDTNMYVIHAECEKLTVGDDEIFLDVVFHQIYPGNMLRDFLGIDGVDEHAIYDGITRACVCFLFDENGMGCGEQAYAGGKLSADNVVKLEAHEVPAQFTSGPRKVVDWMAEHKDLDWPSE
jgi:hypothetical protein